MEETGVWQIIQTSLITENGMQRSHIKMDSKFRVGHAVLRCVSHAALKIKMYIWAVGN